MRIDIWLSQYNFLPLKILYFRNTGGFCLHRIDIFKDGQKDINLI